MPLTPRTPRTPPCRICHTPCAEAIYGSSPIVCGFAASVDGASAGSLEDVIDGCLQSLRENLLAKIWDGMPDRCIQNPSRSLDTSLDFATRKVECDSPAVETVVKIHDPSPKALMTHVESPYFSRSVSASFDARDTRDTNGTKWPQSPMQRSQRSLCVPDRSDLSTILMGAQRVYSSKMEAKRGRSKTIFAALWTRKGEQCFDGFIAFMIVLNVLQIGISADLSKSWFGWLVIDTFFATVFTMEFCIKVWIHGLRGHLCGKTWLSSVFDVVIVLVAIYELILNFGHGREGGDGSGFSTFRIIRLCRLTRIIKVLRLPMFSDLLSMIDGLMYGSKTLFWSIVLLVVPIYSVAIIMRETVGTAAQNKQNAHYVKPFASMGGSFFTCFRCIMGDCSSETGQPLPVLVSQKFGWGFGAGFSLLMAWTSFGMFNVIIAIYVDNIQMAAKRKEAKHLQNRLSDEDRHNTLMAKLVELFVSAALDGEPGEPHHGDLHELVNEMGGNFAANIEVSRATFMAVASTDAVQEIFDKLDINYENRVGLFDALDADGGGSLSITEILNGLTMLRGEPRRADIIANYLILRTMQERQEQEMGTLAENIANLQRSLTLLREKMRVISRGPRLSSHSNF